MAVYWILWTVLIAVIVLLGVGIYFQFFAPYKCCQCKANQRKGSKFCHNCGNDILAQCIVELDSI